MKQTFKVSASPHLHENNSVKSVMWQVVIALIPAMIASVIFFGVKSIWLTLIGIVAAVATEWLIQKLRKVPITISDGSAVLTGMLLAFNLNAAAPLWLPAIGAVFAIAIGKHVFGGLGHNIMNPALLGRAFLVASWPTLTTAGWTTTKYNSINGLNMSQIPNHLVDLVSKATPLSVAKALRDTTQISHEIAGRAMSDADIVMNQLASSHTVSNLFWGNIGGVIGEVSAAALLIGAAFLAYKRIIEWRIPVFYIGTVFVLTYIFGGINGIFSASVLLPLVHIFGGGLMLGALFMATDMVTSPVTKKGRIYFGIGLGLLTVVIRFVGGYPEGVCYSILLMNLVVPLIDRATLPKPFGEVKK